MTMQKKSVIFVLSLFFGCFFAFADVTTSKIISPVPGEWQNPQPLIILKQPETEVYYSLSGDNPLNSGFAYDGPVRLDMTGSLMLSVITVSASGVSDIQTVCWSVAENPEDTEIPADILSVRGDKTYLPIFEPVSIKIPGIYQYCICSNEEYAEGSLDFQNGETLVMKERCDYVRYLSLILKTRKGNLFRYVLRTGIPSDYANARTDFYDYQPEDDLEFASWNYIRFLEGRNVLYSIDNSPWIHTNKPVIIDRTQPHTVFWKRLSPVNPLDENSFLVTEPKSFYIPPKPELVVKRKGSGSNEPIKIGFDDENFFLQYQTPDGIVYYANELSVDVLHGDSLSLDQEFLVYYKGLKQGKIVIKESIDKKIPAVPKVKNHADFDFYRGDVTLEFEHKDHLYYKIIQAENSVYGFNLEDYKDQKLLSLAEKENSVSTDSFELLSEEEDGKIVLKESDAGAVLYTIAFFSADDSGNKSKPGFFHALIDSKNYYVIQDKSADSTGSEIKTDLTGTEKEPFRSFESLLEAVKGKSGIKIHASGLFEDFGTLSLSADCEFVGDEAWFELTPKSQINIHGGKVKFSGCTFRKNAEADKDIFQKYLFVINDADVSFENCELISTFSENGTQICAENSIITISSCGLTNQAGSYSSLVSALKSSVTVKNARCVSSARTALGFGTDSSTCVISDTKFTSIGSLGRVAEFTASKWACRNSVLTSQKSLKSMAAFWADPKSEQGECAGNTLDGFSVFLSDSF